MYTDKNFFESSQIAPHRVLVVDDYTDGATTLAHLLRRLGHEVQIAKNGLDALQIAVDFVPTVVLLDIGLPDMDGYEVSQRLRLLPQLHTVVIIAVTGFGRETDREMALRAGCNSHVTKPVEIHVLKKLLSAIPSDKSIARKR